MNVLAQTYSLTHLGAKPSRITVETDVSAGLPGIAIVGLASKSVEESRERLRSAIRNSGLDFPPRKTVINLAPGDVAKHGTGFELAMALGILVATKQIPPLPSDICLAAELALDGTLRPAQDVIATALSARQAGFSRLIVDTTHSAVQLAPSGLEILRAKSLRDIYDWLVYDKPLLPYVANHHKLPSPEHTLDFQAIRGLDVAKRALEIAAAGNHNVLLSGPPGSGKTLLAQAMPTILPNLTDEEYESTLYIQSLTQSVPRQPQAQRPFRAPHHTASNVALVGGGQLPKPGEVSLAHNGVLFLDELPEFRRSVLESLRQPLEDGEVLISRAQQSITYPANFMLIAAMNPCPCGFRDSQTVHCTCSPAARERYAMRLSGPLLDRFDIQCSIREPSIDNPYTTQAQPTPSAIIRQRVSAARDRQARRFRRQTYLTNSRIPASQLTEVCSLNPEANRLIDSTLSRGYISQRGLTRALKVARTLADLEDVSIIQAHHLAEALQYRQQLQPRSLVQENI